MTEHAGGLADGRVGALATGVVGALVLSTESVAIRWVDLPPWTVAFWAGLLTAVTCGGAVAVRPALRAVPHPRALLASGLCQMVSGICFILAVTETTIANVVTVVAAAPAAAAVAGLVLLGERPPRRVWTGIGVAGVGLLVVVGDSVGRGDVLGSTYAALAVGSYAVNVTIWRRHPGLSRFQAIGLASALQALLAVVPAEAVDVTVRTVLGLLVLGVVVGPVAKVSLAAASRGLSAAEVSLLLPIETVAAPLWAWLAFGEVPAMLTALGGSIVIGAVVTALRSPKLPETAPAI